MQEEQTFYPVTTEYFTACLPLLEKYFGITAGYFNKELSNAKCLIPHREDNIVKYSIKEDCNLVLPFRHLECHDLLSLINSYGTITPIIEEALLLVAYCIRERQIDENEYNVLIQFHTWDIYQSEWAHLLLFMEQMEARAFQGNEQTAITIRTNNGIKEKISIPNSDNWLFRLIKKELAGYFPEVQTAEKARQDIQWRKPSAGRKKDNAIYSAVAYGIYRMLHEENAIPSQPDMPNELCAFIHDFARQMGCYSDNKGWDGAYNPDRIRADLAAYLKPSAITPRFRPISLQRQVIMQDFDFPLLD